jgi:TonB family protein
MDYLYWLLLCAFYLALIWGLPHVLPEETFPGLRWLHWGASVLCLLAVVAPALTRGDWTFRSFSLWCAVLLVSGLLAGTRRRLRATGQPALATTQAVLVGLIAPALLVFFCLGQNTPSKEAYNDGHYSVTVEERFSFMDNDPESPDVQFYRSRLGIFDECLGRIVSNSVAIEQASDLRRWWQGVSAVSFEADSSRGVAWHDGTAVPFSVSPPYHGGNHTLHTAAPAPLPTPLAAPKVYESGADKVYTYVEEMPHLPGTVGSYPVVEAIQRRLVLSPRTEEGRVFVTINISETGTIQNVYLVKGLNAAVDSAVIKAVYRLPRFEPGRQNSQPVKVSLTVPVSVRRHYPRNPYRRTPRTKPKPINPSVPDLSDLSAG